MTDTLQHDPETWEPIFERDHEDQSLCLCDTRAGAAAWYGWSWWTLGRFMETTDDAYAGGEITTIASKVAGFVETVAIADNQSQGG